MSNPLSSPSTSRPEVPQILSRPSLLPSQHLNLDPALFLDQTHPPSHVTQNIPSVPDSDSYENRYASADLPEWAIGQDFIARSSPSRPSSSRNGPVMPKSPLKPKGQKHATKRVAFESQKQRNPIQMDPPESETSTDEYSSHDSDSDGQVSDDDDDTQFTSAKLQESVLAPLLGFNAAIFNVPEIVPLGGHRKRKRGGGTRKGPQKAAEPTGEIKLRLSTANEAFMEEDYEKAIDIISEIIRVNAETYEAWTMLASAWQELGNERNAIKAQLGAVQLRPHHPEGWLAVAERFEEAGDFRGAEHCYRTCLRFTPRNLDARLGKAKLNVIKRNFKGAVTEFTKVLTERPNDLSVIRGLAETYYFLKQYEEAKQLMSDTFLHYRDPENYTDEMPDWNDLVAYISYHEALSDYSGAVEELKTQARWLLGRDTQDFFDNSSDDCEWDKDDDRREMLPDFIKDEFDKSLYGDGLPLNLRVQLGTCRYMLGHTDEALQHFEWLDPNNKTGLNYASQYRELYLEVANLLFADKAYNQATPYYSALRRVDGQENAEYAFYYIRLGICIRDNILFKAEEYFLKAIELDGGSIEARIELGDTYLKMKQPEKAMVYIDEAKKLKAGPRKPPRIRRRGMRREFEHSPAPVEPEEHAFSKKARRQALRSRPVPKKHWLQDSALGANDASATTEAKRLHSTFFYYREAALNGDGNAVDLWLDAVQALTNDFRAIRNFYPFVRPKELPENTQVSHTMAANMNDNGLPSDFRGITFKEWLDIFLAYALFLARRGDRDESYQICEATKDSTVFSRSREDMFLVHVTWCTCALYAADEQACYFVAKTFMKDYQFTSDSYRIFSAVSKMCHSPLSWYMGGPIKKYVHRQIILMDNKVNETQRPDGSVNNSSLDIPLLMLYGHIMYSSASYDLALEYFFRAYALSPSPMIDLSISLTFTHLLLNRRSEDHGKLLLLAFTYLFRYYDARKTSPRTEERQEAHYNVARTYHMLGRTNDAARFYALVLEEAEAESGAELREELAVDAAYNLQTMYTMSGNVDLAKAVTQRWLTLI